MGDSTVQVRHTSRRRDAAAGDPERRRRLAIIDDHPIVRLGIRHMIEAEPDLEICGEADCAQAALALVRHAEPELAVVDLSLAAGTGLELVRALRESHPALSILVLSMHDETLYAERVLRAGARGYIMKREAITGLVGAIRTVLAGRVYVSEAMTQAFLERLGQRDGPPGEPLASLTNRELDVLELIGHGLTTATIARQLRVSTKTIETYRSNIRTKLNLKDAADLVRFATTRTEGL
jgi:DNA-binding NarL/FixJ family response regulator